MLLKDINYTSNIYVISMTIKDSSCQYFSKEIRLVIYRRYLLNRYITPLNYLMDQIILPLHVFTFLEVP